MAEKIEFFPIVSGLERIEPIVCSKSTNEKINFNKQEFSIRGCPAVKDLTQLGYTLPLWQDILIQFDNQKGISVQPSGIMVDHEGQPFNDIQFHDEKVLAGHSFGESYFNFSMKIRCPWYVKTPKGSSILLVPPFYAEDQPFIAAPGLLNTDTYPMILVHIILKKFTGSLVLKKGTPLCQIIVVKEQPELIMYEDDKAIKKNIYKIKNWLYSKMHSSVQYRNLKKIL